MSHRDTFFSVSITSPGDRTLDGRVAEVSSNMIQCSMPGYSSIISIIGMLAERFVQLNTQVHDLNCSLGAVTLPVRHNINRPGCRVAAISNPPAMAERYRHYTDAYKAPMPVEIIEGDIRDVAIENASLVILGFTVQFLEPGNRQAILSKTYQGLNPDGALMLSRKFSFEDARVDELLFNVRHDFKRMNGYNELEISQKHSMLENMALTDPVETHKARLHQAGFEHAELWFQYFNSGSLVAVKSGEQA